ncbi:MAG: histidine kinase [Microbacterium sp.]
MSPAASVATGTSHAQQHLHQASPQVSALNVARAALFVVAHAALFVVALALGVLAVATTAPFSLVSWTRYLAGGLFLVAGSIAALRRPDNRTGALMALVAIGYFAEAIAAGWGLPQAYLALLTDITTPLIFTLGLAFPSGTLTAPARAVVVAEWTVALAAPVAWIAVGEHSPAIGALATATEVAEGALAALIVGMLVRRYHGASHPLRRAVLPAYLVGLAALAAGIALIVAELAGIPRAGLNTLNVALAVLKAGLPIAFVVGLLGMRQDRAAAVIAQAALTATPADLERAARDALGDPRARLLLGTGETPDVGEAVTPVVVGDETLALLAHDPALCDDPETLRSTTAAIGLALHNARLVDEIETRTAELRAAAARLVAATDAARRQVERDLHDGAQQRLVTIDVRLRLLEGQLAARGETADAEAVGVIAGDLESALSELRHLAHGIHPVDLADGGLVAAVRELADRAPVSARLDVEGETHLAELDEPLARTLWFAAAEALTNVARHARARNAVVRVWSDERAAGVAVTDDGIGGADAAGIGLTGLGDRARALGGELRIEPAEPRGTRLSLTVPR